MTTTYRPRVMNCKQLVVLGLSAARRAANQEIHMFNKQMMDLNENGRKREGAELVAPAIWGSRHQTPSFLGCSQARAQPPPTYLGASQGGSSGRHPEQQA